MIRWIRYLVVGLAGLLLLLIAFANRSPVLVKTLPDDLALILGLGWSVEVPLFLVIFAGIAIGLLIGFVWEWLREHKHRADAEARKREVARLKQQMTTMRQGGAGPAPKDDVLALLDGRKPG